MDERLQELLRTEPRVRQKGMDERLFIVDGRIIVGEYIGFWYAWDAKDDNLPLGVLSGARRWRETNCRRAQASELIDAVLSWPSGYLGDGVSAEYLRDLVIEHQLLVPRDERLLIPEPLDDSEVVVKHRDHWLTVYSRDPDADWPRRWRRANGVLSEPLLTFAEVVDLEHTEQVWVLDEPGTRRHGA